MPSASKVVGTKNYFEKMDLNIFEEVKWQQGYKTWCHCHWVPFWASFTNLMGFRSFPHLLAVFFSAALGEGRDTRLDA